MIQHFLEKLTLEASLIDSALDQAENFHQKIEQLPNFQNATISNWVGLGAFRFIPPDLTKKELDSLNSQLAEDLAKSDRVFTKGITVDGEVCILVSVDFTHTTPEKVDQHISLISETAAKIPLSKFTLPDENLEEIIRQGIHQAEEALVKEEENVLLQEVRSNFR
jgi:hypothetical protein